MTRQHFEIIASTLKDNNASENLCYSLACEFRIINARFDLDRFMLACGFGG